jgi:hypothetical protein
LVGEEVAVPSAALHRERLSFEVANCQVEQGAQFGGVQQRCLAVGLGMIDALACLGGDVEEAADGIVLVPVEDNTVLAEG